MILPHEIRRPAKLLAILISAVLAAVFFLPGSATAESDRADEVVADLASPTGPAVGAQKDLDAYWTDERIADTVPLDLAQPKSAPDPVTDFDPGMVREIAPSMPDGGVDTQVDHSYATGRMFFNQDGGSYSCSASAVSSGNQSVVLTAGHCLHAGNGSASSWSTNVIFIPGYNNGNRPRGTWNGIYATENVFSSWYSSGNLQRDVGMYLVSPNSSGQNLTQVTGGHGLSTGQGYGHELHVIGYPQNHDNNQIQWHCWGDVSRAGLFNPQVRLDCDFNFGASGGPWLMNYSSVYTGLGVANGTMSTWRSSDGANFSPYFDDSVWNFYTQMSAL
ncbi:trypsin-like serine peptidase [Glycomyces salinus]|uniref:trypsin-like serine peptidase n=1 Tax=Glycomyces salinus TaxID=980294 RepID=UPI0018EB0428|nr:hypothetical protein [Glycomyces salinus]